MGGHLTGSVRRDVLLACAVFIWGHILLDLTVLPRSLAFLESAAGLPGRCSENCLFGVHMPVPFAVGDSP